jgi:predicted signal transduction protein with EAL and GGDEF domain
MATYAAKTTGRAGVRVFDRVMHTQAVQRLDFEAALRRAVIRQQRTDRYQPVVELAGALDSSGLDPGELMLEITESVLAAEQGRRARPAPRARSRTEAAATPVV